jgi:tetratricopeptide (TPR) repeat protein
MLRPGGIVTTLAALQEAVCLAPTSAEALHALGAAHRARRELDDAVRYFRAALRVQPRSLDAHLALAEALSRADMFDEAASLYASALALAPGHVAASVPLCELYLQVFDRPAEARRIAEVSARANPDARRIYTVLWLTHLDAEDVDAAIARVGQLGYDRRPDLLHRGLLEALSQTGRHAALRDLLRRWWREDPGLPRGADGEIAGSRRDRLADARVDMLAQLARAEHVLGEPDTARAHFAQLRGLARAGMPRDAAYECLSYAWRSGDLEGARQLLAMARMSCDLEPDEAAARRALEGRAILLANDDGHGNGDWVLWSRAGALLRQAGASHVIAECRAPIRGLLSHVSGIDAVTVAHDDPPCYDRRCTISELLVTLRWTRAELEAREPYLRLPPALTRRWRARILAEHGPGLHLGVDWSISRESFEQDPWSRRAIPVRDLAPLTDLPGVICHALHVGRTGLQELASSPIRFAPLSRDIATFVDTAAAISALDAVVTVDTVTAHLAGALGIPTVMLLPGYPDWRWGDADTPFRWYPTVRRLQQRTPGDWTPAIVDAVAAVRALSCRSSDGLDASLARLAAG